MSDARTIDEWADRINAQCVKSVESIFEIGRLLSAAKAALSHGDWGRMLTERRIPFSQDKAERLMAIARHPVLSNSGAHRNFPTSYYALYELSKLPDALLMQTLADGNVTPTTPYREIRRMNPTIATTPPPARAMTRSARVERTAEIRRLASEGASVPQIARAVGLGEERLRVIITHERIDVPADRVVRGARRLSAARVIEQTVCDAENLTADLRLIEIDWSEIDPAHLRPWLRRLRTARRRLNVFMHTLQEKEGSAIYAERTTDSGAEANETPISDLSSRARANANSASVGDAT